MAKFESKSQIKLDEARQVVLITVFEFGKIDQAWICWVCPNRGTSGKKRSLTIDAIAMARNVILLFDIWRRRKDPRTVDATPSPETGRVGSGNKVATVEANDPWCVADNVRINRHRLGIAACR